MMMVVLWVQITLYVLKVLLESSFKASFVESESIPCNF